MCSSISLWPADERMHELGNGKICQYTGTYKGVDYLWVRVHNTLVSTVDNKPMWCWFVDPPNTPRGTHST
jgi:hypothetical protein